MRHFGLIGRGISYSLSPGIHKKAFLEAGIEAEYSVYDLKNLTGFRELMSTLDGANVTIPYKQEVIPLLDSVSPLAHEIGAVNTIYKYKERLIGDNTDVAGFMALWNEACRAVGIVPGDRVAILGNGGAAKAVRYVLNEFGCRHETMTHDMMNEGVVDIRGYKVVVNATPCHRPNVGYEGFCDGGCAIDLTYNPAETEFLREARIRGAVVFNGMTMLVRQGECARGIWIDAFRCGIKQLTKQ